MSWTTKTVWEEGFQIESQLQLAKAIEEMAEQDPVTPDEVREIIATLQCRKAALMEMVN